MAAYPKLGLQKEDGLSVPLLDKHGKTLSFLNSGLFEQAIPDAMLVSPQGRMTHDIAIPIKMHLVPGGFFPQSDSRFTIGTDDKQTFENRFIRQPDFGGLHFTRGNAQVQQYFRKRLQIDKCGYVSSEDFIRYGTTSFLLFRLDENVYFLDFSPDVEDSQANAGVHSWRTVLLETKSPQHAAQRAQREARQQGLPFYPGRLDALEQLPYLAYNQGQIIVVRHRKTDKGDLFQVALEKTVA